MFDGNFNDTYQYLEPFNFVDMLNWIVWNRTIYVDQNGFIIKWLICYKTKPNQIILRSVYFFIVYAMYSFNMMSFCLDNMEHINIEFWNYNQYFVHFSLSIE